MIEILNTIWTSLTTENEGLTNILSIPFAFIEVLVSMLLFTQFLNISACKKRKLLYWILLSIWSVLSNFFIPKSIIVYLNMILCPLAIFLIFRVNFLKSILGVLTPLSIIALCETFVIKFYTAVFHIPYNTQLFVPIYRNSPIIFIYIIIFLIYLLFKKLNININIFDNLDKKSKRILISNSVFGLITIGFQFFLVSFYIETLPFYITIFSILTLIAYFLVSLYTIIKISELKLAEQNLQESQLYNKTLQILHDNVRAFRHDFSNIIAGIGGYVQTKDMDGLEKYYSQLLVDCQCTNNLTTLSPILINNPAIYNVLANKYHKADEKGIKIELSIFYDFNKLNIKIYELTRILGILLDNAIEASAECDKKFINLVIRDEAKYNRQVVLIENTYTNKDVNTDEIFEKGFSTKQGNTGLGLWQVRQILKKNSNLNLFTNKNDEYFIQSLEIYNK